jgi:hypothetical protein
MAIDKASIRKLSKMKEEDDIAFFTTKEILQREEELLAYDNLNFDNRNWEGSSSTEEEKRKNPRIDLLNVYASAATFFFAYTFKFAFFGNVNTSA